MPRQQLREEKLLSETALGLILPATQCTTREARKPKVGVETNVVHSTLPQAADSACGASGCVNDFQNTILTRSLGIPPPKRA
jgi:hypothetical protein